MRQLIHTLLPREIYPYEALFFEIYLLPWTSTLETELRPTLKKYGDEHHTPVYAAVHNKGQVYLLCYTGTYSRYRYDLSTRKIRGGNLKDFLQGGKVVRYEIFKPKHLILLDKFSGHPMQDREADSICLALNPLEANSVYLAPDPADLSQVTLKWVTNLRIHEYNAELKLLQDAKLPAFPAKGSKHSQVNLYHQTLELVKKIIELTKPSIVCFSDYEVVYATAGDLFKYYYLWVKASPNDFESNFLNESETIASIRRKVDQLEDPLSFLRYSSFRLSSEISPFLTVALCSSFPKAYQQQIIYLKPDDRKSDEILAAWYDKEPSEEPRINKAILAGYSRSFPALGGAPRLITDNILLNNILFNLKLSNEPVGMKFVCCKPDQKSKATPAQWKSVVINNNSDRLQNFLRERAEVKTAFLQAKENFNNLKAFTDQLTAQDGGSLLKDIKKEDKYPVTSSALVYQKPLLIAEFLDHRLLMDLLFSPSDLKKVWNEIFLIGKKYNFNAYQKDISSFWVSSIIKTDKLLLIRMRFPEIIRDSRSTDAYDLFDLSTVSDNSNRLMEILKNDFLFIELFNTFFPPGFIKDLYKIPRLLIQPVDELRDFENDRNDKVWTVKNQRERNSLILIDDVLNTMIKKNRIDVHQSRQIFNCFKFMWAAITSSAPVILDFLATSIYSLTSWQEQKTDITLGVESINNFAPFTNEENANLFRGDFVNFYAKSDSGFPPIVAFYLQASVNFPRDSIIWLGLGYIQDILKNCPPLSSGLEESIDQKKIRRLLRELQIIFVKYMILQGACRGTYARPLKVIDLQIQPESHGIAILGGEHAVVLKNRADLVKWLIQLNEGSQQKLQTISTAADYKASGRIDIEEILPKIADEPSLSSAYDFFVQKSVTRGILGSANDIAAASLPPNAAKVAVIDFNQEAQVLELIIKRLTNTSGPEDKKGPGIKTQKYRLTAQGYFESEDKTLLCPAMLNKLYLVSGGTREQPIGFQRILQIDGRELEPFSIFQPPHIELGITRLSHERVIVLICVRDNLFKPLKENAQIAYDKAGIPFLCVTLTTTQLTDDQILEIKNFFKQFAKSSIEIQIAGRGTAKLCNAFGSAELTRDITDSTYSWAIPVAAKQIFEILSECPRNVTPEIYLISNKAAGYMSTVFCTAFESEKILHHSTLRVRIIASYKPVYTNQAYKPGDVSHVQALSYDGINEYSDTRVMVVPEETPETLCLAENKETSVVAYRKERQSEIVVSHRTWEPPSQSKQNQLWLELIGPIQQGEIDSRLLLESVFYGSIDLTRITGSAPVYAFGSGSGSSSSPTMRLAEIKGTAFSHDGSGKNSLFPSTCKIPTEEELKKRYPDKKPEDRQLIFEVYALLPVFLADFEDSKANFKIWRGLENKAYDAEYLVKISGQVDIGLKILNNLLSNLDDLSPERAENLIVLWKACKRRDVIEYFNKKSGCFTVSAPRQSEGRETPVTLDDKDSKSLTFNGILEGRIVKKYKPYILDEWEDQKIIIDSWLGLPLPGSVTEFLTKLQTQMDIANGVLLGKSLTAEQCTKIIQIWKQSRRTDISDYVKKLKATHSNSSSGASSSSTSSFTVFNTHLQSSPRGASSSSVQPVTFRF